MLGGPVLRCRVVSGPVLVGPVRVDQVEERLLDGGRAGAVPERVGGVLGEDPAVAHQEQAVAAFGLVHDVGRDEQRGAAVGQAVEEVPEVPAEYGVEPDGRFVQDQQVRGAEQGDGQRDAAALATGERAGEGVGASGQVDVVDGAGDGLAAGGPVGAARVQDRGEVVEVLPDGEVGVDGGRLGDVADAGAQGRISGGVAQDVEDAGDLGLGAGHRPHEGGLAAARGAEEAGDAAGGDGEVEGVQDGAGASDGGEAAGGDRRGRWWECVRARVRGGGGRCRPGFIIHHVMNSSPGGAVRQEEEGSGNDSARRRGVGGPSRSCGGRGFGPQPRFGRLRPEALRAAGLPVRVERRFSNWARALSYSVRRSFSPGASVSERTK